jgi:EmrB/QacA subfamily drug resistance transporter
MEDITSVGVSKGVTLIIAAIAVFVGSFLVSSMSIALPVMGKELAAEAVLLGWIINATVLAQAVVLLPVGRLADIFGLKKIFLYGMFLLAVSSFLCAISNSSISLVLYRALQGIAGGMTAGTAVAILSSAFPAEERGRAIGINMAVIYLGFSVGPLLGGVLTQHLGWRSIFFVVVFLCLIVIGLTLWRLKGEWAEAREERFDIVGSMVFGISLVVMMYGFTMLPAVLGIVLVLLGIVGILAFVRWEARVTSPILNIGLFLKNKVFVFSNLATLANYCAVTANAFLLSFYLQYNKGLSPQMAGLVLMAAPVTMAIIAPIAGRLSDRVEPRKVATIGLALSFVALLIFSFLTEESALGLIITGLIIFGFGHGFFSSPNTNAIMGSVENRFFGVASGTIATMRTVGQMLSVAIVMILFSIYIGEAQITPVYYPAFLVSMKLGYVIFAALCFGGVFAQLAGRKGKAGTKGGIVIY